ncbi:hypothetical protein BU23DRAFT_223157 [Bimuria novae-zelandiae CBS 107.79]|uniref:Uncharacterized protein n=1 Tax=Bimuria novae-zelandiae CBS 107.79 TaxID=1447943 RepID=A0A6A5VKZ8_9PLEO|nr:hypothetical protein BU23DRAFT_223157 [Bimuria novae-zelandiae CBS 107.79]
MDLTKLPKIDRRLASYMHRQYLFRSHSAICDFLSPVVTLYTYVIWRPKGSRKRTPGGTIYIHGKFRRL